MTYCIYVVRCAACYHLYNLKNVKNIHERVLILVKLFLNCTNGTKSPNVSNIGNLHLDYLKQLPIKGSFICCICRIFRNEKIFYPLVCTHTFTYGCSAGF